MTDRNHRESSGETRIYLTSERVRDAATAGQIQFSDSLVQLVNRSLNDGLTRTIMDFELTSVTKIRSELKHLRTSVAKAAQALNDLGGKTGAVIEAVRTEAAKAADLAGFGTLDDWTIFDSLHKATSMLGAFRRELEWREQEIISHKGRPKAPERTIVLNLHKIYLISGGKDALTWDATKSEFRGLSINFISTVLRDPQLASVLPARRADIGALIKEWRRKGRR